MPLHALRSLVSVTANDAGQHNCIHDKAITRVRSVYLVLLNAPILLILLINGCVEKNPCRSGACLGTRLAT